MANRGWSQAFRDAFSRGPNKKDIEAIKQDIARFGQSAVEQALEETQFRSGKTYAYTRNVLRNNYAELEDEGDPIVGGYSHIDGYDDLNDWEKRDPMFLACWKAAGGKLIRDDRMRKAAFERVRAYCAE